MRFSGEQGRYNLTPMPGNEDVAISHGVLIYEELRGKGYGKSQHDARLENARKLGYSYVICTVKADNAVEKHILAKKGWTKLGFFTPQYSCDYNIEIWGIQLYG